MILECDSVNCANNLNGRCLLAANNMPMLMNEDGTCGDYKDENA